MQFQRDYQQSAASPQADDNRAFLPSACFRVAPPGAGGSCITYGINNQDVITTNTMERRPHRFAPESLCCIVKKGTLHKTKADQTRGLHWCLWLPQDSRCMYFTLLSIRGPVSGKGKKASGKQHVQNIILYNII